MEMSMSNIRKIGHARGFTLIEVLIAITVLAAGLLAVAATLTKLNGSTTTSRYLGTEVMLASEKLENLNQLSVAGGIIDPALAAGGGLGPGNDVGPVLVSGTNVWYFDNVQVSSTNGQIVDNPDDPTGVAVPPPTPDMMIFHRQWIIETDVPVIGVRRITVLVTPQTGTTTEQGATFQTSMVRP
jgi:prepilin-type N-terminal cleavage/methylation domain-containing protein